MEYVDGRFQDGGVICDSCGTQYKVLVVEDGESEADSIEETASVAEPEVLAEEITDSGDEDAEEAPARGRRAKS